MRLKTTVIRPIVFLFMVSNFLVFFCKTFSECFWLFCYFNFVFIERFWFFNEEKRKTNFSLAKSVCLCESQIFLSNFAFHLRKILLFVWSKREVYRFRFQLVVYFVFISLFYFFNFKFQFVRTTKFSKRPCS